MQSANITNHRLLLTALLIGSAMNTLTQLGEAQYIALETYKKNGQAVPTPVWVTQEAGKLYVITEGNSGKVKRIRNNSQVRVAKSDMRGKVEGDWSAATAQVLTDAAAVAQQGKRLVAKYGLIYRLFHIYLTMTQRKRTSVVIEIA
jgi:PPOX class probable F420-dependent enzyme